MTRENAEKYLNMVEWLEKRYSRNGILVISAGGVMSTFKKLEIAFYNKYISRPL